MDLNTNLQLNDLIIEEIDDHFCYIQYDEFKLIMMKSNGYINASKLCKLGGKRFDNWKRLDGSKKLIKELENINKTFPDLIQSEIIITISNEDNKYKVSGYYVHPALISPICLWISAGFAIKVSKIINCFMSGKYEFKLKEIDYLKR